METYQISDIVVYFNVQISFLGKLLSLNYSIARKAFSQSDRKILWSHMSTDGMTESHLFIRVNRQPEEEKKSIKFSIGCGAQRLLKSCSVTKNSIERKIKWKGETFHAFFNRNLSQEVLKSNQIVVLFDQLEIYKDPSFSLFLSMLGDTQMREVLKKNCILEIAGIGKNWKY